MSRFERHIFVCVNERPPGHPKGCCKEKGSEEVRALLVQLADEGDAGDLVVAGELVDLFGLGLDTGDG